MLHKRPLPAELTAIPNLVAPVAFANDYDGVQGVTGICPPETGSRQRVAGAMGYLLYLAGQPEFGADRGQMITKWREVEQNDSFVPTDELQRQLDPSSFEKFMRRYRLNRENYDLVYPETIRYHQRMGGTEGALPVVNFSLTWGVPEWQEPKTTASQIPGHIEITDEKNKGIFMKNMRNPQTQRFDLVATDLTGMALATISAESLILVDDKPSSFAALPADCRGILVDRPEETKKLSQQGSVDVNYVGTVPNLDAIEFKPGMRIRTDQPGIHEALQSGVKFLPLASYLLQIS